MSIRKFIQLPLMSTLAAIMIAFLLTACASEGYTATATQPQGTTVGGTTAMATNASTASTKGAPQRPTVPLTAIRMLDNTNGWALTRTSILKTTDGGTNWKDITPANAALNIATRGDFINSQYAWIATPQLNANTVSMLRTTDGGQHWISSKIQAMQPEAVDMPHFLNAREGWLETIGDPGAGNQGAEIFHSIDGGQSWLKIASTQNLASGLSSAGFKSGISFENSKTGFATTRSITGNPTDAGLFVTYDGGHTWRKETIPMPSGANVAQIGTTPPVFFGTTGFLPVYVATQNNQHELILYRTNDSGTNWTQTRPANIDANTVYILDTNHAWAFDNQTGKFYYTNDSGTSWWPSNSNPGKIQALSFPGASTGWAITDTSLLHTTDGGKTWTTQSYTIS